MAEANFDYDHDVDAEQTPTVDRMNKNYTLYVTNIPAELDEKAIGELFGEHGKIVDLILRPTKGWAYITYGSYREAELAMRNLNNRTPLELQIILLRKPKSSKKEDDAVSFAENSNEIHEQQNRRLPHTAVESLPACNDSIYTQKITRGNPMNALRRHNLVPQGTQTANTNSRSVLSNDQDEEFPAPFDVNRLWTRGVVTVTRDGTRRVSLGRGYTLYEFPDEDPNLEGHIDKVYERRNAGLYEYSEDKLSSGLKSCVLCNTKTIQRCEKCFTYYCSKACQVKDWPRHQANCDRIPALIKDKVNDISSLCIKDENQTQIPQSSASNKTVTQQTSTFSNVKLRRPNIPNMPNMQTGNSSNTVNVNMDKNNGRCSNSNGDNQSRYSLLHINVNEFQSKQENQLTNGTRDSSQNWSPKHLDENTDQSKKNNTSLSPENQHSRSYQPNRTANTKNFNEGNFDNDNNMKGRSQFHQKNGHQNGEKSAFYDNKETVKQENAFTVPRNGQYLSQTKFTNVEITVQLGNNEYWICKDEDISARTDLMNKLEHLAVKSRNLRPIVGSVYGVLYKNTWRRAMVKSFNPLKVHYIDYGNEEILDKNVIFKDIRDLLKISNFAQKIRLTPVNRPYKNLLCNDKISVRMLSVDADDTMVVEMQETSEDLLHATESIAQSSKNTTVNQLVSPRNLQVSLNNSSKKSESQENLQVSVNTNNKALKLCNILYKFMNGEQSSELEQSGFIELHEQSKKNVYNATLCASSYLTELQTIYEDMQADCEKMKVINYKPQADELICGLEKDGSKGNRWHRGYIYIPYSTSPSNIYMRTLDVPKLAKVEKIVQCPEEYKNILTFGVTCIIEKSTEFQLEGEVFQIKVINRQEMKIKLIPEEKSCIKEDIPAVIKPWLYVTPVRSELTSGTKVCITHPYNHYVAFVRSMDDEDENYFLDIMSRVRNCAKTAPFLTKPPNINQIVIAPYIDNNSYRATVIKLLEDDNVLVQYNDFGNIYKLKRQKLQVIPDDLAKERSCLIKILLKDVPRDVTITEEARVYLQNLADTETPLTYIRSSSSEDVYLITATGERINDKIKELLSKTNSEKKYMLRDIGIAELGSVGNIVNAMVMYIEKPGVSYMLIPSDSTLLAQFDALSVPMMEYCNKTKHYIPKNNELCLALYEKEWYRAVCINSKKTQTTSEIFFIDYGNSEIVDHHNIREMHKNFMHPPAMVTKCEVINLASVDSTGHLSTAVQNKLAELMDVYKVVQIKIVGITDNVIKIELPEIRAILIKSGLV